jgi:hypothetical protein
VHRLLNPDGSISEISRSQIAALLASQTLIGVALGIAAQATLVFVLVRYALPYLGIGPLETAQSVAALDLPFQIANLLQKFL